MLLFVVCCCLKIADGAVLVASKIGASNFQAELPIDSFWGKICTCVAFLQLPVCQESVKKTIGDFVATKRNLESRDRAHPKNMICV
jgi:hypothetical protein